MTTIHYNLYKNYDKSQMERIKSGRYLCYCEDSSGDGMYRVDTFTNPKDCLNNMFEVEGWEQDYHSDYKVKAYRELPTCDLENLSFTYEIGKDIIFEENYPFIDEMDNEIRNINEIMFHGFKWVEKYKIAKMEFSFIYNNGTEKNTRTLITEGEMDIYVKNDNLIYIEPFDIKIMRMRMKDSYPEVLVKSLSSLKFIKSVKKSFREFMKEEN